MKRSATLLVGRNRLAAYVKADGVDQGTWLRLHRNETFVRADVSDFRRYLSRKAKEDPSAPVSGLYSAYTKNDEDRRLPALPIAQFVCASPTDGARIDRVWVERFHTARWKRDCSEVARAIAHLISDARIRMGIGQVHKLHIVYTDQSRYLPNIFCNAIGKALGMRSAVSSVAVKHAYDWDERPLYNVRRSHVSDWFRSVEGAFLMLTDPRHRDEASGNELWVWHKDGRLIVQNESSEMEDFRRLTERLDMSDENDVQAREGDLEYLTSAVGRRLGQAIYQNRIDASLSKDLDALGVSNVFVDQAVTLNGILNDGPSVWQIGAGQVVGQ